MSACLIMSTMITHPASDTKPSSNRDTSDTQAEQTQHTLDEKATTASSANASPPGPPGVAPPPDGGLQAWLQVAAAFFAFFNTWGLLNTFGVYQTYYETGQLFRESSSNISWVGSVQAFLLLLVGGLTGPIFDKGYLRSQLLVGTFGIVFGHMMLSISKTFWQVILSQGFVIGIGKNYICCLPTLGLTDQVPAFSSFLQSPSFPPTLHAKKASHSVSQPQVVPWAASSIQSYFTDSSHRSASAGVSVFLVSSLSQLKFFPLPS